MRPPATRVLGPPPPSSSPASSSSSPPPPRAASARSAPGCATVPSSRPGLTTRAQGECTALGSWGRGVPSAPEGLPWPLPVSLAWGSWAFPRGLLGREEGDYWARCGVPAGGGGAWNLPDSPSPGHATASFATSVLLPDQPRPGGRCRGCEPVHIVAIRASVTCVCVYVTPPPPLAVESLILCGSVFLLGSLCATEAV